MQCCMNWKRNFRSSRFWVKKSLIASISTVTISWWLMMRGRRKLVRVSEFELFSSPIRRHLSKASLLSGRNTRRNIEPEVHIDANAEKNMFTGIVSYLWSSVALCAHVTRFVCHQSSPMLQDLRALWFCVRHFLRNYIPKATTIGSFKYTNDSNLYR